MTSSDEPSAAPQPESDSTHLRTADIEEFMPAAPSNIPLEIDCQSVKARLDSGSDFLLLDCREATEYDTARIEGAKLLPMSELMTRVEELESFRGKSIVVHCHHGGRSLKVTNWLRQQGYAETQSMAGGIDEWSTTIDPTVPRY
jgi:rhodanese-related sulfurtransferase